MLDGLFSGKATIYDNYINYTSIYEHIIDEILYFLARINVYAYKNKTIKKNKSHKTTVPILNLRLFKISCLIRLLFRNSLFKLTKPLKASESTISILLNDKFK